MNQTPHVIAVTAAALLAASPVLHAEPAAPRAAQPATVIHAKPAAAKAKAPARLDRSGRKQVGQASFYAPKFNGRKMADGTPMDPRGDNAASKTLPLGTTARVTHLETGRSAVVTIQDRGPFVDGRIVDLSPATAEQIGLKKEDGLAPVEVAPIRLPEEGVASRGPETER